MATTASEVKRLQALSVSRLYSLLKAGATGREGIQSLVQTNSTAARNCAGLL